MYDEEPEVDPDDTWETYKAKRAEWQAYLRNDGGASIMDDHDPREQFGGVDAPSWWWPGCGR